MTDTIIDLIRHGEPEGGRAYRGHSIDDPLSDRGWQQMWSAVGNLCPWQQIITSPMQRCQAFALQLADRHQIPISIETDFREVGFGHWEGMSPDEVKVQYPQEYTDFYHDPVHRRPANAEPLDDFIQRVHDTYQRVIQQYHGQHLLIVSHAGVNRAILAQALHCPPVGLYRIKVNNAGMSRLKHDQYGSHLLYHNCKLEDMKS